MYGLQKVAYYFLFQLLALVNKMDVFIFYVFMYHCVL